MPKIGRAAGPSYAGVTDAPTPQQVALALVHRGTSQFSQRSAARTPVERRRQVATAQFDPAAFRRALREALGAGWAR